MKYNHKERNKAFFNILSQQLHRHSILLIVVFAIFIVANVAITLGWYLSPDDVSMSSEVTFYVAQGAMFFALIAGILFLLYLKFKDVSDLVIVVVSHVFIAFLVAWATVVFCLDLSLGFSPLTYLLIITFIAGVFTIDPFFFAILDILSLIPISIVITINKDIFFGGRYLGENITLFILFVVVTIAICFRNYRVIHNEYKVQQKLSDLSYKDELTGLLNERSYVDFTEEVDRRIDAGEDVKFAIILMDVNNLKATNDQYGHRFGCSLVVRCGHTLPTLFKSSKLFHIGGDEFIAVVMGEDLENFEEMMKKFDEAMLYSLVTFEEKELIFSVARGYHIREEGQHYKDVLQIADGKMYENKKYLKEKYNMKGR